jgi:iron(III) transport system substrate-binding protein
MKVQLRMLVIGILIVGVVIGIGGLSIAQQRMVLYAALDEPTLEALISKFEEDTGISVDLWRGGAGEVAARIRAEAAAPKGDVFIGGSVDVHGDLALEGLLAKTAPENAKLIPEPYKDPEGYWYGWYLGVLGLVLNIELFEEEMKGIPRPVSWDELLRPEWKGKVSTSGPHTSGGAYIFLVTQIFRFERYAPFYGIPKEKAREAGEEAAFAWFKAFKENVKVFTIKATEPIVLTAMGETIVGMSWAHDILVYVEKGYPVELIVPPDTGFEIGGASVIAGGPNPEAAEMFLNFVLSKESQEINATVGAKRYPVTPGVVSPPGAPSFESFSLVPYDREWAIANKARLLDKWDQVIGR